MSEHATGQTSIRVCSLSDLEEGEIHRASVDGLGTLAVYIVDGEIFVTDDACTHGEASLSEDGYIEGFTVTCSWHDGAFDVRTGEAIKLPCLDALRTHAVTVSGGEVFVAR